MAGFQGMGSSMQPIKPEPGHVMVDYFDPPNRHYECLQTNENSNDSLGEPGSITCFENGNSMKQGLVTAAPAPFTPTPATEPKIKNFHYHPYDPITHKASKSQLVTTAPPAPKPRKRPSKSRSNSVVAATVQIRSNSIVSSPECPDSGDENTKTSPVRDRENTAKTQRQSRVKREKESESIACAPKPKEKPELASYEQLVAQYMQIHKQQQQLLMQQTAIIQQLQALEKEGTGNSASLALPQLPSFNLLPQPNTPDKNMGFLQCPPPPQTPAQMSHPPQMVRLRLPGEPIHPHHPTTVWQPQPTWTTVGYPCMGFNTPLPPPPPPARSIRKPSMFTRIRHMGANLAAFVPAPVANHMGMSYPSAFSMPTETTVNLFGQDLPSSPETGGWSACQSPYTPSSPAFTDSGAPTLDLQTSFDLDVLETSPMGTEMDCPPSPLPFIDIEALAAKVDDQYISSLDSDENEVTLESSCLSDLSF